MARYHAHRAQSPGAARSCRRRLPRGLVAAFLACALTIAPLAASAAEDQGSASAQVWAERLTVGKSDSPLKTPEGVLHGTTSADASAVAPLADEALPETYDLRDEGLSTSVKSQGYFGSCWAFGDAAAFESGLLKQRDADPADVDLSELQLATFSDWVATEEEAATLGAPGQAGEGVQIEGCSPLDFGGALLKSLGVLSRGTGFVDEDDAPYRNKEGKLYIATVRGWDGKDHESSQWDSEGDWSVDRSLATKQTYQLQAMGGGSVEPVAVSELAQFADYAAANPDAYVSDPSYIDSMKAAMMEHGALGFSYCASQATFGNETISLDEYTSEKNGAIFVDLPLEANHVVTAVGWDDTLSKENFAEGHQPPADGAWILKNSWGSDPAAEGNVCYWGIDGTGYFYLSYYDATIDEYHWLDPVDEASETSLILQHDLLGTTTGTFSGFMDNEPVAAANVFVAQEDMELSATTVFTVSADTEVAVEVYLLAPDWSTPTDGNLVAQKTHRTTDETYLRIGLDEPVAIAAGQPFSIVQTQWSAADGEKLWFTGVELALTDVTNEGTENEISLRATAVVNPGESYLLDDEGWRDVCDVYSEFDELDAQSIYDEAYGNVMIKALGNPAQLAEGEGVYVAPAEPGGDGGDASAGEGDGSGNMGAGDGNAGAGANPPSSEANGSGGNGSGAAGSGENLQPGKGDGNPNENAQPDGGGGESDAKTDEPEEKDDAGQDEAKESQSEGSQKTGEPLAQTGDVASSARPAITLALAALAACTLALRQRRLAPRE